MPPDFPAYILAHKVKEARARFGIGSSTLRRWVIEAGLHAEIAARSKTGSPPRAVPVDFADHAAHESNEQLRERYRASTALVSRWRKLTGIAPDLRRIQIPADFASRASRMSVAETARHYGVGEGTVKRWRDETGAKFKSWSGWKFNRPAPVAHHGADDLAGRAQRHLQRIGPVFKHRGGFSVFGRQMSDEEMIALARAKGFQPDEWRKVA
jgi:transposase-like protein